MNLLLVTFAFVSFSAVQGEPGANASELTAANRDAPEGTTNTEGTEANGERRICRRITVSGSHRYQRVCMTAEQWRQQAD